MKKTSTDIVRAALRRKYAAPEWALLEEVRNATGLVKEERYADAVAMNLYPSRGLDVLGFEIKVSRSDWLSELKQPHKSAAIQKYCDRWWIVVGSKDIIDTSELPSTWGLMVVGNGRLLISKDAPKLKPEHLDRAFVASLLRRSYEALAKTKVDSEQWNKGHTQGVSDERARLLNHKYLEEDGARRLKESVASFEKIAGIRITGYNGYEMGTKIAALRAFEVQGVKVKTSLRRAKEPLELALSLLNSLESIEGIAPPSDLHPMSKLVR